MSNHIEENVVKMSFDNADFERKVSGTIKSVEKLEGSLQLEDGTRGIQNVSSAFANMQLSGIANSVDMIASRFTLMGIMGVQALMNITNQAIHTGTSLVKSLTITPITTGFNEYETKIKSIQTIMTNTASKGTTLDQVTDTLDELNTYADQTIYNFAEMTRNIGTFTAAGVGLDESATAIKGIANLAAGSGSNAMQASTAMYQMSQALSQGSLKLMDYNSLVNAGMGGELFKQMAIDVAVANGKIAEGQITMSSFRETLQDGWLTTDVLLEVFQNFADDPALVKAATEVKTLTQLMDTMQESVQSGWAQSWEIIVGDMDEAAQLFTGINDWFSSVAGASAEARNEMLTSWDELGGRTKMLQGINLILLKMGTVVRQVTDAFEEVFKPLTGDDLFAITESFLEFSRSIVITGDQLEGINTIAKGFFSIFSIMGTIAGKVFGLMGKGGPVLSNLLDTIIAILSPIAKAIIAFDEWLKGTGSLTEELPITGDVLELISTIIEQVTTKIKALLEPFDTMMTGFLEGKGILDSTAEGFNIVGDALTLIAALVSVAGTMITTVLDYISSAIGMVINNLTDGNTSNLVSTGVLGMIIYLGTQIGSVIKNIGNVAGSISDIGDNFSEIFGMLGDTLQSFEGKVKSESLKNIAISVGILAAALFVISMIESDKLNGSLLALGILLGGISAALFIFNKATGSIEAAKLTAAAGGMILLSVAILILSFAVTNMARLDWDDLGKGLLGVAAILAMLVGVSIALEKSNSKMVKTGFSIIFLAAGILILAEAVAKLGALDVNTLVKGLGAVGAVLIGLGLFTKIVGGTNKMISIGIGMIALATSMVILAVAIEKIGTLPVEVIGTGLATIAGALVILVIAMQFMNTGLIGAIALIFIAGALVILGFALAQMGGMTWTEVGVALAVLAGSLFIIAIAVTAMMFALPGAFALIIISGALVILGFALAQMGGMSWSEVGVAMAVLGASLLILGVGVTAMALALPGALALIIISAALLLLVPSLIALSTIDFNSLCAGLGALVIAFGVIATGGVVLGVLTPIFLALGVAALALGAGLVLLGVGMTMLVSSLALLETVSTEGIDKLSDMAFTLGVLALAAPAFAVLGAALLVLGVGMLAAGVGFAALAIGLGLMSAVMSIGEEAIKNLEKMLDSLIEKTPQITLVSISLTTLSGSMIALAHGISLFVISMGKMSQITVDVINSMNESFKQLETVLLNFSTTVVPLMLSNGNFILTFAMMLNSQLPLLQELGTNMATNFIQGFVIGISLANITILLSLTNLMLMISTFMTKKVIIEIDRWRGFGKMLIISGMLLGMQESVIYIHLFIITTMNTSINIINMFRPSFYSSGQFLSSGLIEGMNSKRGDIINTARSMAQAALDAFQTTFDINSPSGETDWMGTELGNGLIGGMKSMIGGITKTANTIGKTTLNVISESVKGAYKVLEEGIDLSPRITPVVDTSLAINDIARMNSLLSDNDTLTTVASTVAKSESDKRSNNNNDQNDSGGVVNNYNYDQTINSPKQLSRFEIYRQTNNLISKTKEDIDL